MSDQPVLLYDTTLRDGTQREGLIVSLADKIKIARRLDEFGLPYIEGGWPGSNPKDVDFFAARQRARACLRGSRKNQTLPPSVRWRR